MAVSPTCSMPVMEYAWPFTRPVVVLASDSAELVIWRKTEQPTS